MRVHVKGQGEVNLTKSQFVASGGEGSVYAVGSTAYKLYADPSKMIPVGKIQELSGISDPTVIKPEQVVTDKAGKPIGYSMRFVRDTYALCQLFPRTFRDREGLSHQAMLDLVLRMRQQVADIHRAGVLVVDLNEMNFLVSKDFTTVYAIDVDSYQTPHYPATAIMPSVRDWHTPLGDFNENSDWFSFACVAFQMFIGIHPYKGKHPTIKGMEERMKANISVLNPDVRLPQVCQSLDVIPDIYKQWFKAVLEDGKRLPPPTDLHASIVVVPTVKTVRGTANFDIRELLAFGGSNTPVKAMGFSYGTICVVTDKDVWLNGRQMPVQASGKVALAFTPKMNHPVLVSLENGSVKLYDLMKRQELPFTLNGSDIMAYDGRVYVHNSDRVYEIVLHDTASKILPSSQRAANVLEHATQLYPGCAVQDLLGTTFVSVFPASGRTQQIKIPELDKYRVTSARYDSGVLMVEGIYQRSVAIGVSGSGAFQYDRLVFRFDEDYSSYDVSVYDAVQPTGCNFTVLDSGVAVHMNDEEKIELFSKTKGRQTIKVIDDPVLGGDMLLDKQGGTLVFTRGGRLYSMRMK